MAEKFAIYAGEPLALVLQGYEHARSARVNTVAAEWLAMVADLAPTLTEPQWMAVLDALNGTALNDDAALRHAWAEVQESEGLGEKWAIDQAALTAVIKALDRLRLFALREIVARYWELAGGHTPAIALKLAGAKVGS